MPQDKTNTNTQMYCWIQLGIVIFTDVHIFTHSDRLPKIQYRDHGTTVRNKEEMLEALRKGTAPRQCLRLSAFRMYAHKICMIWIHTS